MRIRLDIPKGIIPDRILVTRHLLLLICPIRQLDLMREQIASCQRMTQLELRPQGLHIPIPPRALIDLHNPIIVRITLEARVPVRADFVLEVDVRDGWTHIVRVEALGGGDMFEADGHAVVNGNEGLGLPVIVRDTVKGAVDYAPVVVPVEVGVEGNLLFCGGGLDRGIERGT